MTSARALLVSLRQRGVTVTTSGGRLFLDGFQDVLTDVLVEEIAAHKVELIALLQTPDPPSAPCHACGGQLFWLPTSRTRYICFTCHAPAVPALVLGSYEVGC
jgi:hypothetical protein